MVGEEEAVAEAAASVSAVEVEGAEVRTALVLAPVAESKAYVLHLARTCSATERRRPLIR